MEALAPFWELVKLFCPFAIIIYVGIVYILTFLAYGKRLRQPTSPSERQADLVRFIIAPVTVLISILSFILAPFLALFGLVFFALAGVVLWPLSIAVRYMPRFLLQVMANIGGLGEKIMNLDSELLSNFDRRMRELLRALLGTLGMLTVRFPPLISLAMRGLKRNTYVRSRVIRDIRRFETILRADIAADLLIAIAIDSRHRLDTRLEAVKLIGDLGRPLGDLLHIISVPGIDADVAIEAANQAVATDTEKTAEWENRALQVWTELAGHPNAAARLQAADQLSALGKVGQARALLRALVRNRNIPPDYRAQAAGKLYESSVDTSAETAETPEQIISEAEQVLTNLVASTDPRERLEGAAVLVRLDRQEYIKPILDLLDDAQLDPMLRRRALESLAELELLDELRYAIQKPAPTPEQEWEHRWEAIRAMEKVAPEEAVQFWARLAAQPELPMEKANQALGSVRRLCQEDSERCASIEVQEGFAALRELGSSEATPDALRLAAADTLEALDQVKDANSIYFVLQSDPKVDRRLRRKAAQAVSRLSRALLANRPDKV